MGHPDSRFGESQKTHAIQNRDCVGHPAGTLRIGVEWFFAGALSCRLGTLDIQIHDNRILSASDDHGLTRRIRLCVDFLVRDVGWKVDEISGTGLIAELQMVAPAHARTTSDDVKDRLQLAVVVGAGFSVRLNNDGTGPQLTGPGTRVSNGSGPRHSRGLGRVRIQFARVHDLYALFFPVHAILLVPGV